MTIDKKKDSIEERWDLGKRKASAERRAVKLRNYQRARGRALVRLAQQYPDQYKELLEQERLSDEANGKTWVDITGTTLADTGFYVYSRRADDALRPKQADTNQQNESNNGGEA